MLATQRPDTQDHPLGAARGARVRFALRVMDWRDSNIILGEQMNTRGYDGSRLLPSHKGVGILRPDGETDSRRRRHRPTVRTDYMPNADWGRSANAAGRCARRPAPSPGTPSERTPRSPLVDPATVARVSGPAQAATDDRGVATRPTVLPEPLASVVAYLGEELIAAAVRPDRRTGRRPRRRTDRVRPRDGRAGLRDPDPAASSSRTATGPAGARLPHRRPPRGRRALPRAGRMTRHTYPSQRGRTRHSACDGLPAPEQAKRWT